jgi:HAD superfamily hydrolase (TIGR01509 family)
VGESGASVFIFDCNGVLVDSELIAATVTAEELARVGFSVSPEVVAGFFAGRRPSDMLAEVEAATDRKLPKDFAVTLAATMLRRLRAELRPTAHVDHALTWLRGPKCVASASPIDRIRMSLETTGLLRFFTPYLFSASEVPRGKPAPDLFLHAAAKMQVAPADCIVVEDSPAGVSAARAAGMIPVGFIGGNHAQPHLGAQLTVAGARAVIADMRALKSTVVALRGW